MPDAVFQLKLNVDFGEDDGRDFGSLFEAKDADGRVVCGAGFASVYNTVYRNDRLALQFFVRQAAGDNTFSKATLPGSTTDSGAYMFNFDGKAHVKSAQGDQSGTKLANIGHDPRDADESRRVNVWNEQAGRWEHDPDLPSEKMLKGDGKMRVAGKVLKWIDSTVTYDGEVILSPPAEGLYHHFYYALGHLVFFHKIDTNIRLMACPWMPGQTADIDRAVANQSELDREFPFAMGHFRGELYVSTNQGWSYGFDGKQWRVLQAWRGPGSYQLYSTIHWYDKMLLAHYPSGYLLDYDGAGGVVLENWPPGLDGVSRQSREAQTTMIYAGDLWVGVWPWAELWRYDADADQWQYVTRLLSHPQLTDETTHPYDHEVDAHNAANEMQYQPNAWGQRCTGLAAVGDSLMASSSAKWPWPLDMAPGFLTDAQRGEYGLVTKLTVPGNLAAPLKWTGEPMQLTLTVTRDAMTVDHDGQRIGEVSVPAEMARRVEDAQVQLGQGVFGPFAGRGVAAR